MVQLIDLNDDCLEYICGFLDLKDQLSMKNVCVRLSWLVQSSWRHNYRTLKLKHDLLVEFKSSKDDFVELMSSVNDSLEELHMDRVERVHLKLIDHLRFPKLVRLDCNLTNSGRNPNDEDVLLLAKLFPAITKLTLLSDITGKHICNMHNLVELDLSCCERLKTKFLSKIFSTLKLRKFALLSYGYNILLNKRLASITNCLTLEELKIDDHHLLLFIDGLIRMPKIRQVACYTRDYDHYLIGRITEAHGPRIRKMIYNGVLWSNDQHIAHLISMTNLQQLIMCDNDVGDEQLIKIAQNLDKLQEFHFIDGRLESDKGLVEIVKCCRQLEILNVSKSNVSAEFVKNIIDAVCHRKRSNPLRLYCKGTDAAITIINEGAVMLDQLNVYVEEYTHNLDVLSSSFFQLEWLTDN